MDFVNKIFVLIMSIFLFSSCAKEESLDSQVPYARVNIDINLIIEHGFNNPFHYKKFYSNQGGILYAGYAGVIAINNSDATLLYAYDLCCPYEAPQKNELEMEGSLKMKCPKCGSVYDLMNTGKVESGPATEKLKSYRVFKDGSFYRIYN